MIKYLLLVAAAIALTTAEERWAWSSSAKSGRSVNGKSVENRRQERLEDFGDDESTTKRPQQDEFFGGSGNGLGGGTQRFNGFPGGPVGNPRYPQGPNGFGPVGPGFNGIGGQFPLNNGYGGQFPQQNGFGRPGQFGPGPIGNRPIGNGLYGSQTGGYFPGNGQTTNVLVGPGGPTGLIGRPTSGLTGQSPAVLVGPGGPTGVIGRPPGTGYGLLNTAPNGYGAYAQGLYGQGGYGQNEFAGPIGGNPNGIHQTIDIGINNGYGAGPQNAYGGIRPGGFVGPQHSGLGYPRPGSFGGPIGFGGIPYNRAGNTLAFDEPEETDKSNNKSEGKKN